MGGNLSVDEVGEHDWPFIRFEPGVFHVVYSLIHLLDDLVVDLLVVFVHFEQEVLLLELPLPRGLVSF